MEETLTPEEVVETTEVTEEIASAAPNLAEDEVAEVPAAE